MGVSYEKVERLHPATFTFGEPLMPGTEDIFNYPKAVERYHGWMAGEHETSEKQS